MRYRLGDKALCRTCGQDIEYWGMRLWLDRGNGRECLPFTTKTEVVYPKGKHKP